VTDRSADRVCLAILLLIAGGVFGACINWGLPGRDVDRFLFGDRRPWTGEEILRLLPTDDDQKRGADVDANPIVASNIPILLNATDTQRAEIIRRYRLFSYQPDEMITLMSLSKMKPAEGKLDPRLYQYGGLWIYPVGALLKAASIIGWVKLESSQAYYLDHPADFGKFYIVMRGYVVMWGLIGVWAIFRIARRLSRNLFLASAATLCCIFMPVVVNLSHEAKPHLPGAVMTLLAILSATKFVETGLMRWAILTGILCGGAFGMIVSGSLSFILLPAMAMLRIDALRRRLGVVVISTTMGLLIYAITNPYVIGHLLSDRSILMSNLGNSKAMYSVRDESGAIVNAASQLAKGTSLPLLIAGVIALALSFRKGNVTGRLMAVACAPVMIQFVLFAAHRPAEYARFAVLPSLCLGIAAITGLPEMAGRRARVVAGLMCGILGVHAASYLWHFGQDCNVRSPRMIAAERLRTRLDEGLSDILVRAEPAPYCLPPVDLFRSKMMFNGHLSGEFLADGSRGQIEIYTTDLGTFNHAPRGAQIWSRPRLLGTPLSWASKPMAVHVRPPVTAKAQ